MIKSRTIHENYMHYLILELIITFAITFIGTALLSFYIMGKKSVHDEADSFLAKLLINPTFYGIFCGLISLTAMAFILRFRNKTYIVGFEFTSDSLRLLTRKLKKSSLETNEFPLNELIVTAFCDRKFIFNNQYKGFKINFKEKSFYFVTNQFFWEKQIREQMEFTSQIQKFNGRTSN